MIDLTIHPEALEHNLRTARENGILIPTFRQMKYTGSAQMGTRKNTDAVPRLGTRNKPEQTAATA